MNITTGSSKNPKQLFSKFKTTIWSEKGLWCPQWPESWEEKGWGREEAKNWKEKIYISGI